MATQDIQFNIDFSTGMHVNTVFKNDKLQLKEIGIDDLDQIVYVDSGYWISDPIQFADKFKEYKPFQFSLVSNNDAVYKISVSSSNDNLTWSQFEAIDENNVISNLPSNYVKIRIDLIAGKNHSEMIIDAFDENVYGNEFLDVSNGFLKLKKLYELEYESDIAQIYFLKVFRIDKKKYKKIISL